MWIGIPLALAAAALFGYIVMSLWNWLMPALFEGRLITFWQALGVLALSKILFSGFPHRPGFRDHRRIRIIERMAQMTPEEREKFRAGMHDCGHRRHSEEGSAPA